MYGGVQTKETESAETGTVIDATKYGADPTGIKDSAEGIRDAIAAAKETVEETGGPVTINFPEGEYHIYPDTIEPKELYVSNTVGTNQAYKMKKIGFLFENMHDVTVEGNGSLFMFHGKMTTYATIKSENIKFQNFSFDFRTPTVVDITVESVNKAEKKAVVYVPECYNYSISEDKTKVIWTGDISPYTGEPYWQYENGITGYNQVHNAKSGLTYRGGPSLFGNVKEISDIGNHRLEFTYTNMDANIEEGICFQRRDTTRDHPGMFFWQSKDVVLENVNVHFLHGFGIVGQHSENITLDHVIFETPKDSGRKTVGYADFIQMSGCKGKVTLQNCSFSNPHDDPINVHGTFNEVVEKIAPNKFKVRYMHGETAGFPNYFVGDKVEFVTKGNLIAVPNSIATVTAVEGPTGQDGADASGSGSLKDIIITLDRNFPNIEANTHVVENITYTPEVLIQNNVFKETPTRGILVTTRKKVEIKNNVFDGMGMASIFISNDAQDWRESGAVSDVTIEGNTFYRPNAGHAAILIQPTNPTVSTDATVHENINIKNNNFYLLNGQVLDAKSVKGLSFTGNKIYRYDPNAVVDFVGSIPTTLEVGETAMLTAHASGNSHSSNLYSFNGCKNVLISGNTYDGGLKLGGSKNNMEDSDITNEDGIAIGGSATQLPEVGSIAYESSDESVLTVNSRGQMIAVAGGTAKVRAYTVTGGRKFVSAWHSVTVASQEEDVNTLSVSTDDVGVKDSRVTQEHNKSIQYKVTDASGNPVTGVTWLVQNAADHQETTCAEITQNGLLTTKSDGVVGIVARKDGLEAREVLVINKGGKVLSNAVTIYNNDGNNYGEDATKWSITEDGSIQIEAQSQGLWNTQTTKNIFMTSESFSKDTDTTAIIKLSGQTKSNYDEAGLLIGYDPDNYIFIGRKHGAGDKKIKMVKEINGSATEDGTAQSESEDLYLKLQKSGNTITGYYSVDGTSWTESGAYGFGDRIEQDVKVGFYAASGSNSGTPFQFSNLSVMTGSGDSAETKQIPLIMDNHAPTVTNVSCAYANGALSMNTGTFSDTDGDSKGAFVLKWMASAEENGTYELVPSLAHQQAPKVPASLAGKWVKAVVIPQDSHGLYGAPVYSAPIQVGSDAAVQPTSISISAGKRATTEYQEEVQYTASILPQGAPTVVDWSVVDAVTKDTTSCAQIDENGKLTTKSNGVVEVIARTAGGLEARELLVINKDERALSHEIKIENEEKGKWNLPDDGVVSMKTTVGGLWQGKTVANMFSHALSDAQNVTATIKMEGRTRYGYEEAGLVFYIDQNKYVFVGRKHAGGDNNRRIRLVTWTGTGKADETQYYPNQVDDDPVYLKLEKEGNTFKAFWSADKQTWNDVGTITNESLGQQFKVGFYAGKDEGSQSSAVFKFSDLEIDGTAVPLTVMNQAPTASNVTCVYDETEKTVSADYTFADTNTGDTEGESIIRWMASDTENGTYKLVENESELVGKYAKAIVVPQDSNGLYGAPVVSAAAVLVKDMEEQEIPLSAESGLQSASITGAGNFGTFSSSKTGYLTTAGKDQKEVTAAFAAKDGASTLEVSLNGKTYTTKETGSAVSNLTLPLLSGINVIHAIVTAEDRQTKTEYRFVIIRTGDSNSKAEKIQLNGTPLTGFNADTMEYEYTTDKDATSLTIGATAVSAQASVKIAANGKLIDGNTIPLEVGRNDVDIYITPETKYPQSRYQIAVFVPSETNANLKTLEFESGVILNHPFDTRTTSYTGTVTTKNTKLSVTADEANATIELTVNGEVLKTATNGSLEQAISSFTKGSNRIQVKVTSPDKSQTKTYMLKLVGVSEVELSSLQYNSNSSVGYGSIHKNESTDGNPITLLGEDGNIKTYESGIGGHANMNLYYNIDPSYTKFVSWIGVDQENGKIDSAASIKCSIYLDESTTAAWSSGDTIMGKTTPAKKAEVNLGSAKVIRIFADQANGSNSNDHVSLGDAKFLTTLSDSSVGTFYDVEYRVEPEDAATITAVAGANANASNGDGYIRVSAGSEVTLTAAKAETAANLVFAGWYDETGKRLSKELSYKVSNLQADTVCIAKLKTQAQIDLENACEALESVIEKLEQKHTEEELKKYTKESVAAYTEALEAAKKALADRKKTKETIDQAKAALEAADTALAVCACEITSLTVANAKVVMEAGETSGTTQLTPQAAVAGSCQAAGHPEGNEVSYRYEVTNAGTTGATVSETGLVTVHQAGTATITVTAELASGTEGKRTKTATVTIEVTKPATVTFDANGGSFAGGQSTTEGYADANGNVSAPEKNPEKLGYVFTGWKKADGSAFDFETDTVSGDITLKADWAEQKAGVTLNSAKDFSIGSYSNGSSGAGYRILIVRRQNNTGEIGENHLLGKANTKPEDNKIALLQFDLSSYTAAQGKTLEKVLLRLCMAGSNGALTDNQLKVFAIPSESGITDLTKAPSAQGITLGDGETLPASWSWDAMKAVLDKWNPGEGNAKEFSAAGLSDKYSRTGTNVNMDIRNQKDAQLDKTAYYVDITEAVQNALDAGTKNLILAVNEMKNVEHYFISSVGAKGEGSTEKYDNATEAMAPSLRFYYEEDTPEPEVCTCTLGEISIDSTLSLAAGTTKTLAPSTAINYTGCPEHNSAEASRVTYKYEVTEGTAVTVNPTSGVVTAGNTAGSATVTITATLDGDTQKTKTKTVAITVTEPEPEECTCTLGDISIESTLSLAAGATKTLAPSTAINHTGCPKHSSAEASRVTYKYEVTEGTAVTVNPTSGVVTAGDTAGSATVTITATLDGDTQKTKTKTVAITVTEPEPEECTCTLGDISIESTFSLAAGATKTLAPSTAINHTGCPKHSSAEASRVTYKYEVTEGTAVTVNPTSGVVTAGDTAGSATVTITAMLDGDTAKTKTATVVITVMELEEGEVMVSYYANAGSNDSKVKNMPKNVKVSSGTELSEPKKPSLTGYTFKGWSKTKSGAIVKWPQTITAETEFYAIWEEKSSITVEEAKAAIEKAVKEAKDIYEGPDNYSNASWKTFRDAYEAATGDVEDMTAEELQSLADDLKAATEGLVVDGKKVTTNATNTWSAAQGEISAGNTQYTTDTWDEYVKAYNALNQALTSGEDIESDELIRLERALAAAKLKLTVDQNWVSAKANLTTALNNARAIYAAGGSKYTTATWKAFTNAYTAAKAKENAILADSTADALNALATALNNAKTKLAPAQAAVDKNWVNAKNALTAALKLARPIYLAGSSKYTAASWKLFANAYAAANAKANATAANSTANTLNTLATALDKARKGLVAAPTLKAGDFVEQSGIRYTVIDAAAKTASAAGVSKNSLKKVNILPTVAIKGVTCTVTEIQANGFAKFTKIKTVTIGSNVTKIGKKAFYGCKAMTKLTVNGDVKIFDAQSFGGCKKLKSINFKGKKVPTFKSKVFKGTASNMTVKLSKTLKKGKTKKTMTNKLKKAGISKKAKIK